MRIIKKIDPTLRVELAPKVTGTRAQLHHEASPGLFVHVSLMPDLLAFTCGDQQVAFTIADLLDHVRTVQPGFAAPSATPTPVTAAQ